MSRHLSNRYDLKAYPVSGHHPPPSNDNVTDVEARGEPFMIHNPMTLVDPRLGQQVYSPSPINIQGVTIWSASPIQIIRADVPRDWPTRVYLEPAASLGNSFARSWEKLPDELKIHILSFNLSSNRTQMAPRHEYIDADIGVFVHHFNLLQKLRGFFTKFMTHRICLDWSPCESITALVQGNVTSNIQTFQLRNQSARFNLLAQ
jgi:hypothetical protein